MTQKHCESLTEESIRERLKDAGLRPTKQRMDLAELLWSKGCRHVTAEALHRESIDSGIKVSLATIYNTLHQFTSHQLLREVIVERGCSYFDTNVEPHHHFLHLDTGELEDIPHSLVELTAVPTPRDGLKIAGVDVIIRVEKNFSSSGKV